jgi:hypothetical protein
VTPLRTLARRLPQCPWAQNGLTFRDVDIADYELVFAQAGVALPDPLRTTLVEDGAFELAPAIGAGRRTIPLLAHGQRLLSPHQLVESLLGDLRFGHEEIGALWVFVAPPAPEGSLKFAFDLRFGTAIVPLDQRSILGEFHGAAGALLPGHATDFASWLRGFVEQIVTAVTAWRGELVAGPRPRDGVDVIGATARARNVGWRSLTSRVWRPVLRVCDRATAAAIIDEIDDPLTARGSNWEVPNPIDLLYRLPTRGPYSRRRAVFEVIAEIRPEHGALAAAYDWLHEHAEDDTPAPRDLFRDPTEIGWAHRKATRDRDMRWARSLLWAMGHPWPEPLYEAIELAHGTHHGSRDLLALAWRRIGTLAVQAGVL